MEIRKERPSDTKSIELLTYQAFENHPHHAPNAAPTEHKIIQHLRDSGVLTLSLVAVEHDDIIGHIAFSPVMINGEDSQWYGLGPLSVLPSKQRQGIGRELILAGLTLLEKAGAEGVVLLGEPDYYGRFGFRADPRLTLADVPPEYFLIKPFRAEIPVNQGNVTYHPAFYL